MPSVSIEVKRNQLDERLRRAPRHIIEAVTEGLNQFAIEADREMIQALPHRSGAARKSIGHELRATGFLPSLRLGSIIAPPPYMGILERGGTIKPRHAQHLTIPLAAARTASGAFARFTARQVISSPESFGYDGTFFHRGKKIIFGKRGTEVTPLFKLVDQVVRAAVNGGRGYLRVTVLALLQRGLLREKINAAIRRKLEARQP